jgi:F0F1-type ATP synthase assembly protein I
MQQPPDPAPPPPSDGPDEGLGIRDLVGLGGLLVGAVVFGTLLGWLADQALGTDPALTLTGVAVGIVGGVAGCWVQVRRFLA